MSQSIALGFCNNVDVEVVWRAAVLEELARHYRISAAELDARQPILSERDLVISILGFMRAGSGGERFVSAPDVIERFAARFDKKITLGGTSVRAAIAMGTLGHSAALHLITLNDDVRRLLPRDCPTICSNDGDSYYPHLIVQFSADDRIRAGAIDIRAAQPNRLIYHCNADRIAMRISPDFADLIADARALLISGFNAMQSRALLAQRLETVAYLLARLPADASVYLEDGGHFDPAFRGQITRALGQRVDVYGMNEDELQVHLGRSLTLRDPEQVLGALDALSRRVPARTIVVHTRHWALAHGDGAAAYAGALRAGVTLATTRFCYGDDFTLADYLAIADVDADPVGHQFANALKTLGGERVACVPVPAVDQRKGTTIGLGDAFVGGFLPALLS